MDIYSFVFGALFSLVLVAACFMLMYSHLARKRQRAKNVKGYLDLIPDLTGKQRDQVQEIRLTFLPKVEGIRQNLCQRRIELARLLFAEPSDREKIYAFAERILSDQAELEREVIEHILEEKELLTPPQKRKFCEIIMDQFSSGGLGVHDVKGRKAGC
jgi:Spy/CpxP family protein refolding chaperone